MNILKRDYWGLHFSLRPEEVAMLCSESLSVKENILCFWRLFGVFSILQVLINRMRRLPNIKL